MGRSGSNIARVSGRLARVSGRRPLEMLPTEKNIEESYLFAGGANAANEIREYVIPVILEDGTRAMRKFR